MRKIIVALGFAAILTTSFASCAASRDCQGKKLTRLPNGVVM